MISFDLITQWLKANYLTVIVGWLLSNLLIFVFVSAFIDWYFFRKNRKSAFRYLTPSAKAILMARQNVDKEEDIDCRHSFLKAIIMGGSGFAVSLVKRFLVEGPHIKQQGMKGIINDPRWFEFALFFLNADYRLIAFSTRLHLGLFILHGIVIQLCMLFWGLLPFVVAATCHYEMIQEYTLGFNQYEEDRLIEENKVAYVNSIKNYHEVLAHLSNRKS